VRPARAKNKMNYLSGGAFRVTPWDRWRL